MLKRHEREKDLKGGASANYGQGVNHQDKNFHGGFLSTYRSYSSSDAHSSPSQPLSSNSTYQVPRSVPPSASDEQLSHTRLAWLLDALMPQEIHAVILIGGRRGIEMSQRWTRHRKQCWAVTVSSSHAAAVRVHLLYRTTMYENDGYLASRRDLPSSRSSTIRSISPIGRKMDSRGCSRDCLESKGWHPL